jgi:hypothetical protein
MKRTFSCGHTGKGQFCHACAAAEKSRQNTKFERDEARAKKQRAAEDDRVDLSIVSHLSAVQRQAREILRKVSAGEHPFSLNGKPLRSCCGQVISVPVGRQYRLLFDGPTLEPLQLLSHETYNRVADRRVGDK